MASFDFADIASSLASIFKDEVSRQFNRPSIFNAFASDVLRTVAEEELDVPAPARPATTLASSTGTSTSRSTPSTRPASSPLRRRSRPMPSA